MKQGQDQDEDETVSSEQNKADEEVIVSEVTVHDVLLGRGTGPNEHQGNKDLRSIVAKFQEEYDTSLSRKGRHHVAMKTLQEIKNKEGRFLERASSLESSSGEDEDNGSVHYLQVNEKKAINKIKQAFRYNIQTTKYAKRGLGESLQEEFHDNKRLRLGGGGGFDAASSGEHLPVDHNYRTAFAPSTHRLDNMVEQRLLQHNLFTGGQSLIRDPIPPLQLARLLDQRSTTTPGLDRLDQRPGVDSIGAARSMMEYQQQHTSRPASLYGMVQQRSAYESALAASRITMGGVGPFLSSLASAPSVGARSQPHYPVTVASAPITPAWLRMPPVVLPPANHQLHLTRNILLPPNLVQPLAAVCHPLLGGRPELDPSRRQAVRPSEIQSNADAENVGEEYRIKRSAYDGSHCSRLH